jgi:hypothetical protein
MCNLADVRVRFVLIATRDTVRPDPRGLCHLRTAQHRVDWARDTARAHHPGTTADATGLFDYAHRQAAVVELLCARESGEPGPHNRNVVHPHTPCLLCFPISVMAGAGRCVPRCMWPLGQEKSRRFGEKISGLCLRYNDAHEYLLADLRLTSSACCAWCGARARLTRHKRVGPPARPAPPHAARQCPSSLGLQLRLTSY